MYVYIMRRTQIYLADDEVTVLQQRASQTGVTQSQLIREAVRRCYLQQTNTDEVVAALQATAGAWKLGRREAGDAYVERMRGHGRLASLYGGAGRKKTV